MLESIINYIIFWPNNNVWFCVCTPLSAKVPEPTPVTAAKEGEEQQEEEAPQQQDEDEVDESILEESEVDNSQIKEASYYNNMKPFIKERIIDWLKRVRHRMYNLRYIN